MLHPYFAAISVTRLSLVRSALVLLIIQFSEFFANDIPSSISSAFVLSNERGMLVISWARDTSHCIVPAKAPLAGPILRSIQSGEVSICFCKRFFMYISSLFKTASFVLFDIICRFSDISFISLSLYTKYFLVFPKLHMLCLTYKNADLLLLFLAVLYTARTHILYHIVLCNPCHLCVFPKLEPF